jgi:GNAT superfamily N-acetyltransferase
MDAEDLPIRRATLADASALAEITRLGFESYRAWNPPGWEPPPHLLELRGIRQRLQLPDTWCVLATAPGGEAAGHVGFMRAREPNPAGPPVPPVPGPVAGRAHVWSLFVRPTWWGTGLARRLHALAVREAAAQGYERMQLVTPTGQARARAFYEREGWRAAPPSFTEPMLDLELIRYERPLTPAGA